MPFNPDEFLAEKQAEVPVAGSAKQFDPDAFLASEGVDQLPNNGIVQAPAKTQTAPILDERGASFAQGVVDMAMPLSRYAAALGLKSGGQVQTMEQGMEEANKRAASIEEAAPGYNMAGKGFGLLAGGLLGGLGGEAASQAAVRGISKLTASETAGAIGRGLADIAGMSLEGGAISVLNDQPKTFEDALHSFSMGATIAGALGLSAKGVGAAGSKVKRSVGNALEELDDKLTQSAKLKQAVEIEQAQKAASLKKGQVSRSEEILSQRQSELDLTKTQLEKTRALIEQEPFINERVSNLPNKVNELLDAHLKEVGTKKSAIIQKFGEQRVDPTPAFKSSIDSLESMKNLTPNAEASRNTALKFIKDLDQRLFDNAMSPTDSLVGIRRNRDTNVATLDKQHDQLQELLFDKGFLEGAPKGSQVRQTVEKFERSIREQLNNIDPTGELAGYNNAYHNLKNARDLDGFANNDPTFFMQKAKDPNNPKLLGRYREFERNLLPESEGGKLKAEVETNVDLKNRFKAIRDIIRAESEPAMLDYRVLQEHKPKISTLENRVLSLEQSIDSNKASLESRRLGAENADIAVLEKQAESPRNALEALLPAKLRAALNFRRSINDNEALVGQVKNSIMQSAPVDYSLIGLQAAGRGGATRLPSALGYTGSEDKSNSALSSFDPDGFLKQSGSLKEIK